MVTWLGDGGVTGFNATTSMPTDVNAANGGQVSFLLASNTMVDVEGVTRVQYPLDSSLFIPTYAPYLGSLTVEDRINARANFGFGPKDKAAGEDAGRVYAATMVVVSADYFDGKRPSREQMLDVPHPHARYYRSSRGYAKIGNRAFTIFGPRAEELEPNTKYWIMVMPVTVPQGSPANRTNDVPLGGASKARGLSVWTNRTPLAPTIVSPRDGSTTPSGEVLTFAFRHNDPDRVFGKNFAYYQDLAGVQVQYAPQPTPDNPEPEWLDLPITGDELAGNPGEPGPGWYIAGAGSSPSEGEVAHRGAAMLVQRQSMPLDCERAQPSQLAGQLPAGAWQLRMRTYDYGHPYGIYMFPFGRNGAEMVTTTPENAPEANTSPWSETVRLTISERVPAPIPLWPVEDVAIPEDEPVTLSWLYRNTYTPPFPQAHRTVQIRRYPETEWTTLVSGNSSETALTVPESMYHLYPTEKYEWRVQVTDSGIAPVLGDPEPGVYPIVGWRDGQWRYRTVLQNNTADYSATDYNDSAWSTGLAPIGDRLPSAHEELGWRKPRTTVNNANRRIWLRRDIDSPGAGLDVRVTVRVDGAVRVWWNGELVADPGEDWSLTNEGAEVVIPEADVLASNVLAVCAVDDEADPVNDAIVLDVAVDAVGLGPDPDPSVVTPGVDGVTSAWSEVASFWMVNAPASGPIRDPAAGIEGATLGCGTHRVFVYRRGGRDRIGELTDLSHVDWNRVRDDISDAKVVVSNWGVDCGELLRKLQTWAYELVIFRDNGFGVERVWEGPITLLTYEQDSVTIQAKDVMAYAYRRIIRQALNDSGDSPSAGDSVVSRATKVLQYTFAPDDPNVLRYLRPLLSSADARQYRSLPPYSRTAFEEVDDMAANAGLDYTCSGRSILLWGTKNSIGLLPEFRDEDLGTPPIVSEYGMSMANHYAVSDGTGIWGAAVRGGLELDEETGRVSGNDEDYGLVEMLSSTWASETEEEAGTYTEEGLKTVRASFREYAERSISDRYPPPVVVRVPDNTTLNPGTVLSIQQLVPGAVVPLRSTSTLRSVVATQKLDKVQVIETSGKETISITLSPFNAEDAIPDDDGGEVSL